MNRINNNTMNKFNLQKLCVNYNVYNGDKTECKTISIIDNRMLSEVLKLHRAVNSEAVDLSKLTGFVQTPYHISRYSARLKTFDLAKAVEQAIRENNTIVITEILPEQLNDIAKDQRNKRNKGEQHNE